MRLQTLLGKLLSLPYTKPVLLISHHQCQILIVNLLLDQRVGSDDNICHPHLQSFINTALLRSGHGAHQQINPDIKRLQIFLKSL